MFIIFVETDNMYKHFYGRLIHFDPGLVDFQYNRRIRQQKSLEILKEVYYTEWMLVPSENSNPA